MAHLPLVSYHGTTLPLFVNVHSRRLHCKVTRSAFLTLVFHWYIRGIQYFKRSSSLTCRPVIHVHKLHCKRCEFLFWVARWCTAVKKCCGHKSVASKTSEVTVRRRELFWRENWPTQGWKLPPSHLKADENYSPYLHLLKKGEGRKFWCRQFYPSTSPKLAKEIWAQQK